MLFRSVSAIKKDGVPLYKLARQGKVVEREPRFVHVYAHEIKDVRLPEIDFRVVCSKGFTSAPTPSTSATNSVAARISNRCAAPRAANSRSNIP